MYHLEFVNSLGGFKFHFHCSVSGKCTIFAILSMLLWTKHYTIVLFNVCLPSISVLRSRTSLSHSSCTPDVHVFLLAPVMLLPHMYFFKKILLALAVWASNWFVPMLCIVYCWWNTLLLSVATCILSFGEYLNFKQKSLWQLIKRRGGEA